MCSLYGQEQLRRSEDEEKNKKNSKDDQERICHFSWSLLCGQGCSTHSDMDNVRLEVSVFFLMAESFPPQSSENKFKQTFLKLTTHNMLILLQTGTKKYKSGNTSHVKLPVLL